MEEHAGVERAAARAHHQAVERRKAHGGGDAVQLAHRAEACAAAEMRDDRAPACGVTVPLGKRDAHVFVGQAVKAVAAHAAFPQRMRQRQHLLDLRQRAMERGVEARDLRQFRQLGEQHLDRLEREGLMQRGERNVALQLGEHRGVDAHRRRVPGCRRAPRGGPPPRAAVRPSASTRCALLQRAGRAVASSERPARPPE